MAKFLTTTGVSYQLEEIIKDAKERLVLISPFLRVNERVKELLEDKDRLKIDVRVIYGKNELQPEENNWLESMTSIRTSFCKNLHAKCYLNENEALLTSMNLYEFSQVNNNEMGLLVSKEKERELYEEIYEESMRIVRVSEEIRVTVARVETPEDGRESQPWERSGRGIPERLQRYRKTVSAFGVKMPYLPIQLSHTANAATRVGDDTKTRRTRKSAATLVETSTRRLYSSPYASLATRSIRMSSSSQATIVEPQGEFTGRID